MFFFTVMYLIVMRKDKTPQLGKQAKTAGEKGNHKKKATAKKHFYPILP